MLDFCQILYLVAVTALKLALSSLLTCVTRYFSKPLGRIKPTWQKHECLSGCLAVLIGVIAAVLMVISGCSGASGDCTVKTIELSIANFLSLYLKHFPV